MDFQRLFFDYIGGWIDQWLLAWEKFFKCQKDNLSEYLKRMRNSILPPFPGGIPGGVSWLIYVMGIVGNAIGNFFNCFTTLFTDLGNANLLAITYAVSQNLHFPDKWRYRVIRMDKAFQMVFDGIFAAALKSAQNPLPTEVSNIIFIRATIKFFSKIRDIFKGAIFGSIASRVETAITVAFGLYWKMMIQLTVPFVLLHFWFLVKNEEPVLLKNVLQQNTPRLKWYAHRGIKEKNKESKYRIIRRRDPGGNKP